MSTTRTSRAEEVTIEVVAKHSSVDANPRHPLVANPIVRRPPRLKLSDRDDPDVLESSCDPTASAAQAL